MQNKQETFSSENQKRIQMKNIKDLKIVAVSDTHGSYYTLQNLLNQQGDIFIHAGDFTYYGIGQDFDKFFQFLDKLKFKHKIVISGNHEIALDNGNIHPTFKSQYLNQYPCKYSRQYIVDELKKRAIYLEHQYAQVEGLKIFGSPYTTYFCGNAFQIKQKLLKLMWNQIPQNLDILITHGPPHQILDKNCKRVNGGCPFLNQTIRKVQPKVHLFGHIHQAKGFVNFMGINCYNVAQKPQIINFP